MNLWRTSASHSQRVSAPRDGLSQEASRGRLGGHSEFVPASARRQSSQQRWAGFAEPREIIHLVTQQAAT
jgi:hypothetical protein